MPLVAVLLRGCEPRPDPGRVTLVRYVRLVQGSYRGSPVRRGGRQARQVAKLVVGRTAAAAAEPVADGTAGQLIPQRFPDPTCPRPRRPVL
jgi:hypothetical protein